MTFADLPTENAITAAISGNTGQGDDDGTFHDLTGDGTVAFPELVGTIRNAGVALTTRVTDAEVDIAGLTATQGFVTLTDAATIAVNATAGSRFFVQLTGDGHVLGNPTGAYDSQQFMFRIKQPSSGGPYTYTLGNKFRFGLTVAAVTPGSTASKADYVGAIYVAADDKFDVLAFSSEI